MSTPTPTPSRVNGGNGDRSAPVTVTATHTNTPMQPNNGGSPIMTLFRFLNSPTLRGVTSPSISSSHSLSTGSSASSSDTSPISTPTTPMRALSEPNMFASPSSHQFGSKAQLQRAHSLDVEPFSLDGAGPVIPVPNGHSATVRTFTVQAGLPIAEAQRKKSNGFLELLCKQDAFMGND